MGPLFGRSPLEEGPDSPSLVEVSVVRLRALVAAADGNSPSLVEVGALRAEAASARADADQALEASRSAIELSGRAIRVALRTGSCVRASLRAGLSDFDRAEIIGGTADLVSAYVAAEVGAHVRHHFDNHPLVRELAASSLRPLTEAFTRQEAEDYMVTVINESIASVARTWRVEVAERGQIFASVVPSNAQAEEARALRTTVNLLQSQVNLLTARLDSHILTDRGRRA